MTHIESVALFPASRLTFYTVMGTPPRDTVCAFTLWQEPILRPFGISPTESWGRPLNQFIALLKVQRDGHL